MELDDICRLFHRYNFDNDTEFQSGLEKIFKTSSLETPERFMQAKILYFSKKFKKKITTTDYENWLKNTNVAADKKTIKDKEITEDKDFNTPKQTNDLNINTCVSTDETDFSVSETQDDSKIKVKNIQKWREGIEIKTVLSDRENCEGPSFGQVIDMVSKGIPLPGLTDLEIKPLDMEPTMTKMERKAKPWEQG
ncbi:uncharacterized protein LOC128177173 isoform X1 [Crassostrea angulata]|uniref:Uncharacterized protein n=1 Tax=Magallana gigas TaxID=29159 RepID=A0A8W8I076_MAGGI|nr:uncharacterized protein LOC105333308 isoform X1 [Crassostrea gigas]XP_052699715.1 uncharacterized protein LOC128177173 isoform X1 [Crassostrea angulata]|eukprot:XP_011434517.1 PREDICTED: uncharacterized protein LOC105333308 isoform X1 [Crassostrea gigas]